MCWICRLTDDDPLVALEDGDGHYEKLQNARSSEIELSIPADTTTNETIAVGGTLVERLETVGDRDWFGVTLSAGVSYEIALNGAGASSLSDPIVRLYDSTGSLVASNDDGGPGLNSLLTFSPTAGGEYFIEAASFDDSLSGTYRLSVDTEAPPSGSPTDALDWGTQMASTQVNVYFAKNGERFDGETSLGWNAYERQQAMDALGQFSDYTNLTFTEVSSAANADFKLVTTTNLGAFGYMNPPGEVNEGVGVFARDEDGWDQAGGGGLERGGLGYVTLIHEFGHGLGLAHPHDNGGTSGVMAGVTSDFDDYGTFNLNQGVYTTMTYNDGWASDRPSSSTDFGLQYTAMALDVALLQEKYGTNTSHNTGNNIYDLPTANALGTGWSAIWDAGGGRDGIRATGTTDAVIDLRPATIDYSVSGGGYVSAVDAVLGGYTVTQGTEIEVGIGGGGADSIFGNTLDNFIVGNAGDDTIEGFEGDDRLSGNAGDDTLIGGAGEDRLIGGGRGDRLDGGAGRDIYTGSAGADVFVFNDGDFGGSTAATGDRIVDFSETGNDVIELVGVDAITGGADDAFSFIDTAAFSGSAGELRYQQFAAHTRLSGDTDGDGTADFMIRLDGVIAFNAADFVL